MKKIIPKNELHIHIYKYHSCAGLRKMEDVKILRKSYNDFWDLNYERRLSIAIDYCPYCGVKLGKD